MGYEVLDKSSFLTSLWCRVVELSMHCPYPNRESTKISMKRANVSFGLAFLQENIKFLVKYMIKKYMIMPNSIIVKIK